MKRATIALMAFTCAAVACDDATLPPNGQLLITVTTDAPLPPPPGESLGPNDPLPLFDRLRVEVFRPGEATPCRECTNEFDVDRQLVASGRASFGITPPIGATGYVARLRLFPAAFVIAGEPRADATIDMTVALPATRDEGLELVAVTMHTDDVAKRLGSRDAPLAAVRGRAQGKLVGTWSRAKRVACAGTPRPGEACVRGGAFWMGSPRLQVHEPGDEPVLRLVALAPFFIGAHEVTVGDFRASGLASEGDPAPFKTQTLVNAAVRLECDFTETQSNYEFLPLNCVSWEKAASYCAAHGGDLPTEAQFQFVASAFGTSAYVWGDDAPTCDDAVYARAPVIADPSRTCPRGWVEKPGNARRDRLTVDGAGGVVVDLAGNLAEYARDRWSLQGEPCWQPGVLVDPVCDTPSSQAGAIEGAHTIVGGDWVNLGGRLAGASRRPAYPFRAANAGSLRADDIINVGFRCTRPAAP